MTLRGVAQARVVVRFAQFRLNRLDFLADELLEIVEDEACLLVQLETDTHTRGYAASILTARETPGWASERPSGERRDEHERGEVDDGGREQCPTDAVAQ